MFSDHNGMKLETNRKISLEIRKLFEMKKYKTTIYQNLGMQ